MAEVVDLEVVDLEVVDLEVVKKTILGVFCECFEAFTKAQHHPEQYQACVDSVQFKWMQTVIQISTDHPELSSLNDILSFLAVSSAEEYKRAFKEQIWVVYDAVYEYAPLETFLQGDFGDKLNDYIRDVQSDDDTDDEDDCDSDE
jgi:hypothetical protein